MNQDHVLASDHFGPLTKSLLSGSRIDSAFSDAAPEARVRQHTTAVTDL